MKKRFNFILVLSVVLFLLIVCLTLTSCSDMETVNHNLNMEANQFKCERRITVYNARTDKVILEIEGYMAVDNNINDELVVTCKVGANEYKKNYVYLNEYTLYVIEDISGTHTDSYHYKVYFHTEFSPDIDIVP
jgi:hypothetical protein